MARVLLSLLLVLTSLASAQDRREAHRRMLELLAPPGLARELDDALWPVAQHFPPSRPLYLSLIYNSPPVWRLAGLTSPSPAPSPKLKLATTNTTTFDDLIVGSGPAGCVAARVLAAGGRRVGVLERGPYVVPGSADTRELPELKEDWGARPTADGLVLLRTARAVGGGSTVNVDLAFAPTLPFVRERLASWRRDGLLPYSEAEVAAGYAWVCQQLGTRSLHESEINANNRILWEGALELGLRPSLYDLNTWPPGSSPWSATDKRSDVECLLEPALRDGAQLVSDVEVERVVIEEGRAVGVLCGGRLLRAKRVLLCAGAQGTAALLLRSKVTNPAIGQGPVLHPCLPLIGEFDRRIDNLSGTPCSVYLAHERYLFEAMNGTPEYLAQVLPGRTGAELGALIERFRYLGGFGVLLLDEPDPANRITLDAQGQPVLHYRLDGPAMKRGIEEGVRLLFAGGARRVHLPTAEPGLPRVLTAPAALDLRFLPGQTFLSSAHMQATCKTGPVLEPLGRVRGVENLYVLDSAAFPTSVGANPMQTIYTLAYLKARSLLAESRS